MIPRGSGTDGPPGPPPMALQSGRGILGGASLCPNTGGQKMDDWFASGGSGKQVDVPALLDSAGAEALWEVVSIGALVSIGMTRDGGALGVTVTVDGRWRREYFRDPEELSTWMSEALPAVRQAVEAAAASSVADKRGRSRRGL